MTFTYETGGKRQVLLNDFQKNGMAGGHDKNELEPTRCKMVEDSTSTRP